MPRFLAVALLLFLSVVSHPDSPALAAEVGPTAVVVLHGKLGGPDRLVADFAAQLSAAGFVVVTPEMPWSRRREFAESFDVGLREIDTAVRGLRARGAARVVLAGHSLGGNAALAYAARYPGLDGLVCLAPAHTPEQPHQRQRFAADIALAREMVASGRGQDTALFHDVNMGKALELTVPAQSYLSYNDPDGPAVMPKNAAALKTALPILWIVGARDPLTRPQSYVFDLAPAHPQSRYVSIDADHKGTPTAAAGLVVEWLRGLGLNPGNSAP